MHSLWTDSSQLELPVADWVFGDSRTDPDEVPQLDVDFPVGRSRMSLRLHMQHLREGLRSLHLSLQRKSGRAVWEWRSGELCVHEGPFVTWDLPNSPGSLLVRCFAEHRPGAVRFFMDMVTRGLNPTQALSIQSAHGCEFRFSSIPGRLWVWMELVVRIETRQELDRVRELLPMLEREIGVGLQSRAHASRLIEMRGMSHDEKILSIQERVTQLMAQRPHQFSADLMQETQIFLASSRDEFRMAHRSKHLTRLILAAYYFRKLAKLHSGSGPRVVQVRVLPTHLQIEGELKPILGVMVAIWPMQSHERFEESHLLAALQTIVPAARLVAGSFLCRTGRPAGLCVVYADVELEGGSASASDRALIRQQLAGRVRQSIAELLPPMFMPRNEEEVMRHIVTLSQQLRYVTDAPQVVVSFERQTGANLVFTVVVLRLQKTAQPSIEGLLQRTARLRGEWSIERRRMVGLLRKRHPKEASVLRVMIPSSPFLRQDQSVDLVQARCAVAADLEAMIGSFRDYNGGMLQQHRAALEEAVQKAGPLGALDRDLFESFFHAIMPGERRALLPPDMIASWFRCLQQQLAIAELAADQPLMRYHESPTTCMGLAILPEPRTADQVQELSRLRELSQRIGQDRESAFVQLALPGMTIFGVLTTSVQPELREVLRDGFRTR
jgi:hypothetical protein